jgi:hypothetical protein
MKTRQAELAVRKLKLTDNLAQVIDVVGKTADTCQNLKRSICINNCLFGKTGFWQGFPSENRLNSHSSHRIRQVVGGACIDSPCFFTHAFSWTRQNGIEDLNNALPPNSGVELIYANDNNFGGQVIGLARIPSGVVDGFVATPTK